MEEQKTMKRAWLLTWNPEHWKWEDYQDACAKSKRGIPYEISWNSQSKQPEIGDDVFLMRVGTAPKGIVAHGYVTEASHEAPHYTAERSDAGDTLNYLDVAFDWIQYAPEEPILSQEALKEAYPEQAWSPQGSGIEVREPVHDGLMQMWRSLVASMQGTNLVFYGASGTGKTYHAVVYAVATIEGKTLDEVKKEPYETVLKRFHVLQEAGQVIYMTSYKAVNLSGIEARKKDEPWAAPHMIDDGGIFESFCEKAAASAGKPFVFIVEGFNTEIFDGVKTLIEASKRKGAVEAMEAVCPYAKAPFSIPQNVYIVGTAGSPFEDPTLMRRFQFVELKPDVQVLRDLHADKVQVGSETLDVAEMLETINERLKYLAWDEDFTLGHAFFVSLKDHPDIEHLAEIFQHHIIPLLRAHFRGDLRKLQIILRDNAKMENADKFLLDEPLDAESVFHGISEDDLMELDPPEKKFTLQKAAFYRIQSYQQIL